MKFSAMWLLVLFSLLSGCAQQQEPTKSSATAAADVVPAQDNSATGASPPVPESSTDEDTIEDVMSLDFNSPEGVRPGVFSYIEPSELQFGCVITLNFQENNCTSYLASNDPDKRLVGASALWRGNSRRHAAEVIAFVAESETNIVGLDEFRRSVEEALEPAAIIREMKSGDYRWGAWLASLKPNEELVPVLIDAMNSHSQHRGATAIALGMSKDPRALKPLLRLLDEGMYSEEGLAAAGLIYLGNPAAEPGLIAALESDQNRAKASIASALRELGTSRAIPALERLAKDKRYVGPTPVIAKEAIEKIKSRMPKA